MIQKLMISMLVFFTCMLDPKALTINSLYGDMSSTSSNTENLLLYAKNLDENFIEKDYVIFRNEQYSYYIVWGDLTYNGSSVVGSDVDYVRYLRSDSMVYSYSIGKEADFTLLNINYLVTSNITGLGIASPVYETMQHEKDIKDLAVISAALLMTLFIFNQRKVEN